MLKDKKILLIDVSNSSYLSNNFDALQAEVEQYDSKSQTDALWLSFIRQSDYVILEVAHADSLDIARFFAKNIPLSRIILLVEAAQATEVVAKNIQIHALLLKGCSLDECMRCFWQLNEGYFYFSKELAQSLNRPLLPPPSGLALFEILSPREREVVSLISEGLTNRQIAENLFISPETVKNHKKNIIQKLDLSNNNELMLFVEKIPTKEKSKNPPKGYVI